MISLEFPSEASNRYLSLGGIVFGPFDQNYALNNDRIEFRPNLESLVQGTGIFHENDVEHDKFEGDLLYLPLLGGAVPSATAQYPCQLNLPVYDISYTPKKSAWLVAPYGLAINRSTSMAYSFDQKLVYQYAFFRDPATGAWTYWSMYTYKSAPTYIYNFQRFDFLSIRNAPTSYECYVNVRNRIWSMGGPGRIYTGIDLTQHQSYDKLVSIESLVHTLTMDRASESRLKIWEARVPSGFSPQTAKQQIDAIVCSLFPEFPLKGLDYGELAMQASKKTNANHVNMIAFLRDLRHPMEMVPKLRNLRDLKSVSNDYLAVQYGILPTISDLQGIVRAFRRIAAYVDRNGFDTYSAGFSDSKDIGAMHYTLEQHIKLAIDDEDSEFQKLIGRLDSMGSLPTLQNVWDLIPYSFVLDWFVDVGGFLERVDTGLRLLRLNIRYATMSQKQTAEGELPISNSAPYNGSIKWVHYHRWVSDQCPAPPLSLESHVSDFNHWLESSALIFQRAKR